jgi:hypothetical protein
VTILSKSNSSQEQFFSGQFFRGKFFPGQFLHEQFFPGQLFPEQFFPDVQDNDHNDQIMIMDQYLFVVTAKGSNVGLEPTNKYYFRFIDVQYPLKMYLKSLAILEKASISLSKSSKIIKNLYTPHTSKQNPPFLWKCLQKASYFL